MPHLTKNDDKVMIACVLANVFVVVVDGYTLTVIGSWINEAEEEETSEEQ